MNSYIPITQLKQLSNLVLFTLAPISPMILWIILKEIQDIVTLNIFLKYNISKT